MPVRLIICISTALAAAPLLAAPNGEALYTEHCASCHGSNLEGQPNWRSQNSDGSMRAPPHDDSGHTWHHPDKMLRDYIRLGGDETLRRMGVAGVISAMPGFGDVIDDMEIESILNFIKSKWSPRARNHQQMITEASQ